MRLFSLKLNSLLVIAVAALLALGAISAFADSGPPDPPGDGEAVCGTESDGDAGDDGDAEPLEFFGVVISVSDFGLALRTDSDVILAFYTPETVFEDSTGDPISPDQVVRGVSAFVLADPSDNPNYPDNYFDAVLVHLQSEGDAGGDETEGGTDGDVDCGDEADDHTDGDTDGGDESDGDDGDDSDDGDETVDATSHDGDGPNPDRGCANGSLVHAREVLAALLGEDHPGENEGILNALEKMCHGAFASNGAGPAVSGDGDGDESGDHPGNGNAFGRGHGQGKPEGVPANGGDGDEDDGDGPPEHAPAHGRNKD